MPQKNFEIDALVQTGPMSPEVHDTNWIFEKNLFPKAFTPEMDYQNRNSKYFQET